ncbi:MAG: thrombospondin type 3 repeat-containing protein [Verrucomicrobiota bacterium]
MVGTNTELTLANNADFAVTTVTNGGPPCTPGVDTDGDGMEDCAEICAGTDPFDANDFLWVHIDYLVSNGVNQLTFPTISNRVYWIEINSNLLSNGWNTIRSNLPGLGTNRVESHTSTAERIYYRIGVDTP